MHHSDTLTVSFSADCFLPFIINVFFHIFLLDCLMQSVLLSFRVVSSPILTHTDTDWAVITSRSPSTVHSMPAPRTTSETDPSVWTTIRVGHTNSCPNGTQSCIPGGRKLKLCYAKCLSCE